MARDRDVVGESTSNRLLDRMNGPQKTDLTRQSMPGGGEVYRGPVATEALQALGARAMTVDHSIIVSDDFNPSRPEDQALYAHEVHHLEHSGGEGGHSVRDAEEIEARAVESMVLHRSAATSGGYEAGYAGGAGSGSAGPGRGADQGGRGVASGVGNADGKSDASRSDPDPVRGYTALQQQGLSHVDIIERLARQVVGTLDEKRTISNERHRDKKGWR